MEYCFNEIMNYETFFSFNDQNKFYVMSHEMNDIYESENVIFYKKTQILRNILNDLTVNNIFIISLAENNDHIICNKYNNTTHGKYIIIHEVSRVDDFIAKNYFELTKLCQTDELSMINLYTYLCYVDCFDIIKFLYDNELLYVDELLMPGTIHCITNNNVELLIKLQKLLNFPKRYYRHNNNYILKYVCKKQYIHIIKFLHETIGLTIRDFSYNKHEILKYAILNNCIKTLLYLSDCVKIQLCDVLDICVDIDVDLYSFKLICEIFDDDGIPKMAFLLKMYMLCKLEICEHLINKYLVPQNVIKTHGKILLNITCEKGTYNMIVYLCEKLGISNELLTYWDDNPLLIACQNNNFDVANYIINKLGYDRNHHIIQFMKMTRPSDVVFNNFFVQIK